MSTRHKPVLTRLATVAALLCVAAVGFALTRTFGEARNPAPSSQTGEIADVPLPALAAYDGQDLLVHLLFAPGRPGENNTRVQITNYDRTAFSGDEPDSVDVAFSAMADDAAPTAIAARRSPGMTWSIPGDPMEENGWWKIEVTIHWLERPPVVVPFFLLLPDPNLNGLEAPEDTPPTDPEAAAAYESAMSQYTGVNRIRYAQSMANQFGTVSYGVHAVNDGADGSTPGFTFDIPGGWQYVVLGETAWSKRPGRDWEQSETNPMIPPAEWDDEYTFATGFQFGREEMIDGERCRTITFVVPGTDKRVIAWYIWWVGVESGWLRQEMMISQSHYMLSRFSDFDAPAPITPPVGFTAPDRTAPIAGTPEAPAEQST